MLCSGGLLFNSCEGYISKYFSHYTALVFDLGLGHECEFQEFQFHYPKYSKMLCDWPFPLCNCLIINSYPLDKDLSSR